MSFAPLTAWKDPASIEDYGIDWSGHLDAGETVAAVSAAVEGVSLVGEASHDDTSTVARVSGGTPGAKATLIFTITTSSGEVLLGGYRFTIGTPPG